MTRNRSASQPSREFIAVERLLCAARSPRRHRERLNVLRLALMGERSLIRLAAAGEMSRGSVAGCLAAWRNGGFAKLLDCNAIARLPKVVIEAFQEGMQQQRWQSVTATREWFLSTHDINIPLRALRYWMIVETAGASFFAPAPIATDLSLDAPTKRISLGGQRTLTTALPISRRERLATLQMAMR